jgi:methyl-accepting chemotaxis protein
VENTSNEQKSTLEAIVYSFAGLMLLTLGLAIILLKRQVATPVVVLARYLGGLSRGDFNAAVPYQTRTDEIGEVSKAVGTLRQAAMDKDRLERAGEEARAAAEAERAEREAEKLEEARQAEATISLLGDGLDRVAHGDLLHRITTPFAPRAEKLRTDFNAAVEKLQQAMLAIATSTRTINVGTQEISVAAGDLSQRTEQQASSLDKTTAALGGINATVKKAAEGASHARQVVAGTKLDAENSDRIVRQAVDAMGGIEKSSQQIGQIIGVIDEIAFQTNLLALNAGVEAARAGDAGRGFAVVASEVRALAQRSADAAKEIKALISASTAQVGEGVRLVAETGQSLAAIMAKVADISAVVDDIAAGAQEQASGLDDVNQAVAAMDKVTQQNGTMAEEALAASRSLAKESAELHTLVDQFRVANAARPASPKSPAVLAMKPQPKPQLVPMAGRNGQALHKPERASAEDSWQDF